MLGNVKCWMPQLKLLDEEVFHKGGFGDQCNFFQKAGRCPRGSTQVFVCRFGVSTFIPPSSGAEGSYTHFHCLVALVARPVENTSPSTTDTQDFLPWWLDSTGAVIRFKPSLTEGQPRGECRFLNIEMVNKEGKVRFCIYLFINVHHTPVEPIRHENRKHLPTFRRDCTMRPK